MTADPQGRAEAAGARVPRRAFVAAAVRAFAAWPCAVAVGRSAHAQPPGAAHPAPRRGVSAVRVLAEGRLADDAGVRLAFADARRIPQVLDGLRCHCPCREEPGYRSLLSCFEGDGMAQHCEVCRGQARLAARLHRAGRPLADVRAAVDARFG